MTTVFQKTGNFTLFLNGGEFSYNIMTNAFCNGEDPNNSNNLLVIYQSLQFSIPKDQIQFQMNQINFSILKLKPTESYTEYTTTNSFKSIYNTYLTNV
jgi:hypothetical protein